MTPSRPDEESPAASPGPGQAVSGRHSLREQDLLWADFLALAASVVNSLEKSVQAICEGRFDLISEVEDEEDDSDRREVLIEQECLRILALYEPVASDLRRMATVLKVNRDSSRASWTRHAPCVPSGRTSSSTPTERSPSQRATSRCE